MRDVTVEPGAPVRDALLERVRACVPALAAEAAESERLRRPTDAAIALLEQAGLFRLMVPRAYGGLELDLDSFLEAGLAVAAADISLAWVACFYVEHNWMLCQFPERFQRALYAERDHVLAPASIAPVPGARREGEGFRIDGRWKWGTGVMHGDHVIVAAFTDPADGAPEFRFFALPKQEVKVEDVWHVDGMIATGSNDIVVSNVWVPRERSVGIAELGDGKGEGARLHAGPLYRTPMIPILSLAASMPVVGHARTVVEQWSARLQHHVRYGGPTGLAKQAERPAIQQRLARAAIESHQAERLLRDQVAEVMALRDAATRADRARWAAGFSHAAHQARRVIDAVAQASGASAHFRDQPLQRALRDANMACCHIVFEEDGRLETYGRTLVGLDPGMGLL